MNKNPKLNIAFFGTPKFAVLSLEQLKKAGIIPSLIVTSPDKPKGRKLIPAPSEAKVWAGENGVSTLEPEKLKDPDFIEKMKEVNWDLFLVSSYGKIIPKAILDLPKHGTLNIHPSLLPKLRGPSPIQTAILEEEETGVSIMLIDEEMDHGPVISQKKLSFGSWPPKASELEDEAAILGGAMLAEVIPRWVENKIEATEQDHDKATYSKKIEKSDGLIDLDNDDYENYKKIQAFDIWPQAYFLVNKKGREIKVTIKEAVYEEDKLIIKKVLPEGGKEMDYQDFLRGL